MTDDRLGARLNDGRPATLLELRRLDEGDLAAALAALQAGRLTGDEALAAVLAIHRRGLARRDPDQLPIPTPSITTGPEHLSPEGAAALYLRTVVDRIHSRGLNGHGSGVTDLVKRTLTSVADAIDDRPAPAAPPRAHPDAAAVWSAYWDVSAPTQQSGEWLLTLKSKTTAWPPDAAEQVEADAIARRLLTGPLLRMTGVSLNGYHLRHYRGAGVTELAQRREGEHLMTPAKKDVT